MPMPGNRPALIIGGTHSGSGKTTVTLGIMAALSRRGLNVQPFKCGPDFIDPTLHRMITGRVSRNLDVRMCGEEYVRGLFARLAPENGISVVEGVMGLFDGGEGSGARLSRLLDLPVLLVVDVRSAAESIAAVVHGFETLDPKVRILGVVFNRVASERHARMVTEAVEKHCRAGVIGSIPCREEFAIPSRHLGLHMGDEKPFDNRRQDMLADMIERHLDLNALIQMASGCGFRDTGNAPLARLTRPPGSIRIGVARDEAFCFYYEDNLELLRESGAEIIFFSPLHEQTLPEGLHGIYLGGGYPELHAPALSENASMREEILRWSNAGLPLYAECGGFMYLTLGIEDRQNSVIHLMAGVFPVVSRMQKRLRRLGYRELRLTGPTLVGETGQPLYGHEFHYSEIEPMPPEIRRLYRLGDGREEGYAVDNTLAGYIHLHWGKTPEAALRFVDTCRRVSHVLS